MKSNIQAFTLIELLVVVLVIGILAAVAVPQYQKAVLKSQMTQAFITGKAFLEAQDLYFLANGAYASSWNDLDLQFEVPSGWSKSLFSDGHLYLRYLKGGIDWDFYPSSHYVYCLVEKSHANVTIARSTCENLLPQAKDKSTSNRHAFEIKLY
ncbi:MAG: prepilin-type N-terminal cleavage/methylation domain-containing protein [Elusimicrobiaceae bacterium]|nr:prepilin-type N-terminal cleavage/methylation domain-containing protein [Elusimicrobiaceae bacterium]